MTGDLSAEDSTWHRSLFPHRHRYIGLSQVEAPCNETSGGSPLRLSVNEGRLGRHSVGRRTVSRPTLRYAISQVYSLSLGLLAVAGLRSHTPLPDLHTLILYRSIRQPSARAPVHPPPASVSPPSLRGLDAWTTIPLVPEVSWGAVSASPLESRPEATSVNLWWKPVPSLAVLSPNQARHPVDLAPEPAERALLLGCTTRT